MFLIKTCSRIIEYSFYALFLLVPLAFTNATSELFEMNKMWLTWGLTIIITASWLTKMILEKRIIFQRTPLDIPIGLFLLSQIISTIFSLDSHVSFWGYYSRFNGGLLSIASYILLYYAFLSNLGNLGNLSYLRRLLFLSLISGLIVALWGLPSHFGYDPTCFLFRGTLDVSCWTADFMPKIRIFSTLGQPDWLAAYLAILIPISIAMAIRAISDKRKAKSSAKGLLLISYPLFLISLFYVDLLYTRARSGFLGIWIALIFFFTAYIFIAKSEKRKAIGKSFLLIASLLLLITFVIGTPINQLNKLTLPGLMSNLQKPQTSQQSESGGLARRSPAERDEGGTESGHIRLNVWTGAINAWRANPLFGTGVETYAFAYYKYKPAAQNLTSEWNFLYNKAHNEYLNYLATTGLFGLGTYLGMIGFFLTIVILRLKAEGSQILRFAQNDKTLILALMASYLSILVTNFFGFSVVITNIYLFMIPAFVFVLSGIIKETTSDQRPATSGLSPVSLTGVFFVLIASFFLLITLFRFWRADIAYALGYNLDRAGEYQKAYENIHKAVELRGSEPVFKDELSVNNAIIAAGLLAQDPPSDQKEQTISIASNLAQEAINISNEIISKSPNNAVFWKTRTRVFYTLSQIDPRYLPRAMDAIEKASFLAPNDANIWYNLGVLYGQNNKIEKGIEALEKTIKLKPNYRDAHYALGLFYDQNKQKEKAIGEMQYILDHIAPQDAGALESIKNWK